MDINTRGWDLGLLHELFVPEDITRIKEIKPVVSKEDYWSWDHTKSGDYTVKSGNWLANQLGRREFIQNAEFLPSLNGVKSKVWSLATVPKIKAFLWRALSEALPVVDLLRIRGLEGDTSCQLCGLVGESVNHVLFTCTVARQIWALSRFPTPVEGFVQTSLISNFFYLLQVSKNSVFPIEIRRLFPWILWRIWKNRNTFLFEGILYHPLETCQKIEQDAEDWGLAQIVNLGVEEERERDGISSSVFWNPPPKFWIKCNVGCDWDGHKGIAGAAWILRDELGHVIMHSRRTFSGIGSKREANLKCAKWAVEAMSAHHFDKVLFALEADELVGAVNRPRAWPSFAYQSAELLRCLQSFLEWKFVLESHNSNRGVSLIAQSAARYNFVHSYVASGPPSWLIHFLEDERSLASV